jgi:hypothetical protein
VLLVIRAAAVAAALFWSVPFFGLVDLATLVVPGEFVGSVPLEVSLGALFTVIVAGAFVRVVRRPADRFAPAVQLLLAAAAPCWAAYAWQAAGASRLGVDDDMVVALARAPRAG